MGKPGSGSLLLFLRETGATSGDGRSRRRLVSTQAIFVQTDDGVISPIHTAWSQMPAIPPGVSPDSMEEATEPYTEDYVFDEMVTEGHGWDSLAALVDSLRTS